MNIFDTDTSTQISLNINSANGENKTLEKETWTKHHEKIFIEWGDKAMCYRWLHNSAHIDYQCYNTWFTIPVICISTVTGTANFAQERFPDHLKVFVQVGIGTFNIIAAILTTIQQFLKISELNEAHRVSSLLWGKFYRDIKVEMAKSPKERKPPSIMLKYCKAEYDRLMEVSPIIPQFTIQNFKDTFNGKKRSKNWRSRCTMLCCNGYICCQKEESYECDSDDEYDENSQNNYENDLTNLSTPNANNNLSVKNRKASASGKKVKKKLTENQKIQKMKIAFEKIHKPEICDELVSTSNTTYKPMIEDVIDNTNEELENLEKRKNYENISASYVQNFSTLNGREPTFIEYKDGINKSIPEEYVDFNLYSNSVKEIKGPNLI